MAGRPITALREFIAGEEITQLRALRDAKGDIVKLDGAEMPAGLFTAGNIRNVPGKFNSDKLVTLTLDNIERNTYHDILSNGTLDATTEYLEEFLKEAIHARFRADGIPPERYRDISVSSTPKEDSLLPYDRDHINKKIHITFKLSGLDRLHTDDHYYLNLAGEALKEAIEEAHRQHLFVQANPGIDLTAAGASEKIASYGTISAAAEALVIDFPHQEIAEMRDQTAVQPFYATSPDLKRGMTGVQEEAFLRNVREKFERHLDKGRFGAAKIELDLVPDPEGGKRLRVISHHKSLTVRDGALADLISEFSNSEAIKRDVLDLPGNRRINKDGQLVGGGSGKAYPPLLDRARIEAVVVPSNIVGTTGYVSGRYIRVIVTDDKIAEQVRDSISRSLQKFQGMPDDPEVNGYKLRRVLVGGRGDYYTEIQIPLLGPLHAESVLRELERNGAELLPETRKAINDATVPLDAAMPYSFGLDDMKLGYLGLTQVMERREENENGGIKFSYVPRTDRKITGIGLLETRGEPRLHLELGGLTGIDFSDYGGEGFIALQDKIIRTITDMGIIMGGLNTGLISDGNVGGRVERHLYDNGLEQTFGKFTVRYPAPGTIDKLRISVAVDTTRLEPNEDGTSIPQLLQERIDFDRKRHRAIVDEPVKAVSSKPQGFIVRTAKGAVRAVAGWWEEKEEAQVARLGKSGAWFAGGAAIVGAGTLALGMGDCAVGVVKKAGDALTDHQGGVRSETMEYSGRLLQEIGNAAHIMHRVFGELPMALYAGFASVACMAVGHRSRKREGAVGMAVSVAETASLLAVGVGSSVIEDPVKMLSTVAGGLVLGPALGWWHERHAHLEQDATNAKSRVDMVEARTDTGHLDYTSRSEERRAAKMKQYGAASLSTSATGVAGVVATKVVAAYLATGHIPYGKAGLLAVAGGVARWYYHRAKEAAEAVWKAPQLGRDPAEAADALTSATSYETLITPHEARVGNKKVHNKFEPEELAILAAPEKEKDPKARS